jgi:hypothetical protein
MSSLEANISVSQLLQGLLRQYLRQYHATNCIVVSLALVSRAMQPRPSGTLGYPPDHKFDG